MADVSWKGSGHFGCPEPARSVLRSPQSTSRTIPAIGQRRDQHQVLTWAAVSNGYYRDLVSRSRSRISYRIPIIHIRLLLIWLTLALSVLFFGTPVAESGTNESEDLLLQLRRDRSADDRYPHSGRPERPAETPPSSNRARGRSCPRLLGSDNRLGKNPSGHGNYAEPTRVV